MIYTLVSFIIIEVALFLVIRELIRVDHQNLGNFLGVDNLKVLLRIQVLLAIHIMVVVFAIIFVYKYAGVACY